MIIIIDCITILNFNTTSLLFFSTKTSGKHQTVMRRWEGHNWWERGPRKNCGQKRVFLDFYLWSCSSRVVVTWGRWCWSSLFFSWMLMEEREPVNVINTYKRMWIFKLGVFSDATILYLTFNSMSLSIWEVLSWMFVSIVLYFGLFLRTTFYVTLLLLFFFLVYICDLLSPIKFVW